MITIATNYEQLSLLAAEQISHQLLAKPQSILGLPTGYTPLGMYALLRRWVKEGKLDFSQALSFNLDEYCGLDVSHPANFHTYMNMQLFDFALFSERHFPCSTTPAQYDALISNKGGLDLVILGIGRTGHIGFNEPGSSFHSITRVVQLSKETIADNEKNFSPPSDMPQMAVTMGIETILKAKKIILLVSGKAKAEILKRALEGPVNEAVPASILQTHSDVLVIADPDASALLKIK